jgi:S1-C subfamily serine protease
MKAGAGSVDSFTNPEQVGDSRMGLRAPALVGAIVVGLIVVSIAGSAYWRPDGAPRVTLQLGRATPVSLSTGAAVDAIPRVLDLVSPAVAFLTIPEAGRSGSGVVVHEAGFVLTNAHVVDGVERLRVAVGGGLDMPAEVYGIHRATDVAVVKVLTDGPISVAALGDSDQLQVGEFVLAIGAPFGLEATATSGIISGLHRRGLGIASYEDFIITDAPINRGNSGGPLVNLRGEVIGINTAIIAGEDGGNGPGGFAGVGFAIPINVARAVAQRLIGDGGLTPEAASLVAGGVATGGASGEESPGAGRAPGPEGPAVADSGSPADAVARVQPFDAGGNPLASGSGFLVGVAGRQMLVTNEHVVRDAVSVEFHLPRRSPLIGSVAYVDAGFDLAVIIFHSDSNLPSLWLGGSEELEIGDNVRALGARTDGEVAGTVTGLDVEGKWAAPLAKLIETTANIAPGDSGGPLLGEDGRVVGVLVGRDSERAILESGARRSYAIPVEQVRRVVTLQHAASRPPAEAGVGKLGFGVGRLAGRGVVVIKLDPASAAARAGLRGGDLIVAADGVSLAVTGEAQATWFEAFSRQPAGTLVTLTVVPERGGGEVTVRFYLHD